MKAELAGTPQHAQLEAAPSYLDRIATAG